MTRYEEIVKWLQEQNDLTVAAHRIAQLEAKHRAVGMELLIIAYDVFRLAGCFKGQVAVGNLIQELSNDEQIGHQE